LRSCQRKRTGRPSSSGAATCGLPCASRGTTTAALSGPWTVYFVEDLTKPATTGRDGL